MKKIGRVDVSKKEELSELVDKGLKKFEQYYREFKLEEITKKLEEIKHYFEMKGNELLDSSEFSERLKEISKRIENIRKMREEYGNPHKPSREWTKEENELSKQLAKSSHIDLEFPKEFYYTDNLVETTFMTPEHLEKEAKRFENELRKKGLSEKDINIEMEAFMELRKQFLK